MDHGGMVLRLAVRGHAGAHPPSVNGFRRPGFFWNIVEIITGVGRINSCGWISGYSADDPYENIWRYLNPGDINQGISPHVLDWGYSAILKAKYGNPAGNLSGEDVGSPPPSHSTPARMICFTAGGDIPRLGGARRPFASIMEWAGRPTCYPTSRSRIKFAPVRPWSHRGKLRMSFASYPESTEGMGHAGQTVYERHGKETSRL